MQEEYYRGVLLMAGQWLFVEEILYYTVHWVIKSAFLVFYLRLSPDSDTFRQAVYTGVGLNTLVWITSV